MPSARRACCSASSDCPSRRFFRHSLKSFIPASEGDVVPIQWDIGSFLNPAGTSRVTEGRVSMLCARANRTAVQLLVYSLLLSHRTGKYLCKAKSFHRGTRQRAKRARKPLLYCVLCEPAPIDVFAPGRYGRPACWAQLDTISTLSRGY